MKSIKKVTSIILSVLLVVSLTVVPAFAQSTTSEITRTTVTVNGDASTTRGFTWYTKTETKNRIQIAATDGSELDVKISSSECEEFEGNYMHKMVATNLLPGKTYTYRVGDGTNWSEEGTFTTDNGDDKINFIAIADVQAGSLDRFKMGANTLMAAYEIMPDADFYTNLGDFTDDSDNKEWDLYAQAFDDINRNNTLVPVSGNHDGFGVWHWFDNMFALDKSESVQNLNGVNYSYDYGNAHFTVLNTNDMGAISQAQLEWAENDLNSTDKDWKIVFMHKSPYSLGKDAKWPDALSLQDKLATVFDNCNVDVVFSGHDHMYLRTKTIYGNEYNEDGTTYILAGTAGKKRYEFRQFLADAYMPTDLIEVAVSQEDGYYFNGRDFSSCSTKNIGGCFSCISIDGDTLTLNAYILSDDMYKGGEKSVKNIDTMTITKELGENEATYEGENTTSVWDYIKDLGASISNLVSYTLVTWLPTFIKIIPAMIYSYIAYHVF